MNRRTFLTGVAGIGGSLTGCIQPLIGSSDSNPTEHTPRPLPKKPKKLTNETVARYIEQHEAAVLYNQIQNDPNEQYERIEIDCRASVTNKTEAGYYVRARCGLTLYPEANSGEHGDGVASATYLVNKTTTRRLSSSHS